MSETLFVVVHIRSGRVFTAPGGEVWARSVVNVLGEDRYEVRPESAVSSNTEEN